MNGIINLLKPSDMSSQQAVSALKRILKVKKVGHGGTLDPAAAGVLPVFLDQATRLVQYTVDNDKQYIAQIQFGLSTDTQDAQGRIADTNDAVVGYEQMQSLIDGMPRILWQTPPAYSAIKIDGQKMVNLARKGIQKEIPRRKVFIHEAKLLRQLDQNAYLIRIDCSKGTYIRTICHDLGMQTGAYAHCSFLLRTRSGPFLLRDAVTFEQVQKAVDENCIDDVILPMGLAVSDMDRITLLSDEVQAISFGQAIHREDLPPKAGPACSLWYENKLIGIGIRDGDMVKPKKVLCGEREH